MTRVLLVDDEPQLLRALSITLRARSYDVTTASTGQQALDVLEAPGAGRPDVVVLDLGLPDLDGVEVVRRLRAWSAVPVVVLSARRDLTDKVEALDAGADDYLIKPFAMDELLARLRAAVRRSGTGPLDDPAVVTGAFTVDLLRSTVTRDGRTVHLTATEWRLLEVLARHAGQLVLQRQLLQQVWGPSYQTETNYLRLYLNRLRKKLEPEPSRPRHLLTDPAWACACSPSRRPPVAVAPTAPPPGPDDTGDANAAVTPASVSGRPLPCRLRSVLTRRLDRAVAPGHQTGPRSRPGDARALAGT